MDLATKLVQSSDKALLSIHIAGIRPQHWRTDSTKGVPGNRVQRRDCYGSTQSFTVPSASRFPQLHTSPFGVRPKRSKGNGG